MTINKYKGIKIAVLIIVAVGIVLAGLLIGWNIYMKNNPDKVFLNSIYGEIKNIDFKNIINEKEPYINEKGNFKITGEIGSLEGASLSKFDDLNMSWDSSSNSKTREYFSNLIFNIGQTKYLDTDFVVSNNAIYIKLKDAFNKYIQIGGTETKTENIQYTAKEMDEIGNRLLKVAKNSFKKEYFTYETQEVIEGNKTLKLNTAIINMNNDKIKQITMNIAQNLKDDGYLVEKLAEINGLRKEDQIKELENSIQEISNQTMDEYATEYIISTSVDFFGNLRQIKIDTSNNISYIYKKYKNTKEYILTENNNNSFNVKSVKNSKGNITTIEGNYFDGYMSGTVNTNNIDNYSKAGEYNIYTKNKKSDTEKQLEIKGKYTSSNKLGESKFDLDIGIYSKNKNISNMKLIYDNKREVLTSYTSPVISNVVKYEELTSADYEQIMKAEPFKSLVQSQELLAAFISGFFTNNQNSDINESKYNKLVNDRRGLTENVNMIIAQYMAQNNGKTPVIISEGLTKPGEVKIELSEEQKIFTISSSGAVTYKSNMTANEFVNAYGITSEMEIPEWVELIK